MKKNIKRAKELVPAIILTILSMIQALAMELYWSKIEGAEFLWQGGWPAVIGWLQMALVLLGLLLVWVFYVSFVLRFSWLPTLEDTLVPFFIGLLEFAMIDLIYPHPLGPWFLLLAAIYATSTVTSHMTLRRARQDPANDYFFSKMGPASWRDYVVSIAAVTVLSIIGIALWLVGDPPVFSVVALAIALVALLYQFYLARRYWMHSLVEGGAGPEPKPGVEP